MAPITIFTSESVTEGHTDKLCDQISDALLDELIKQDPLTRAGIETLITACTIVVAGEVSTRGFVDVQKVVRRVVKEAGYTDPAFGLDGDDVGVLVAIHEQSPDIKRGVVRGAKRLGAGDQGIMFGYACRQTKELMPLPIILAHKLARRLALVRKQGVLPYLRPDGKSQVAVEYKNCVPVRLKNVVLAAQHAPEVSQMRIKQDLIKHVIRPVCGKWFTRATEVFVNTTGRFVVGGPEADTGLTGRKVIVDTYGGWGRHGGGCFSGKDPSKVDRSATYMARYIAKNIVASGLADECEVQISYVIGRADPTSLSVNTNGTGKLSDKRIAEIVERHFPLTPHEIISHLKLRRPIYRKTAVYGHFGRTEVGFTWEKTDKAKLLSKYVP